MATLLVEAVILGGVTHILGPIGAATQSGLRRLMME